MDAFDIHPKLLEAVNSVTNPDIPMPMLAGFRRDLDIRPLYLLCGLDKSLMTEVYSGSTNDFLEDESEEARIHAALKIVPQSSRVKHSIDHYGGSGSQDINHFLWHHHLHESPVPAHIKSHVDHLDSILLPKTYVGATKLYTGVQVSPATTAGMEWNSTRAKKLLQLPAFTSTSTNFDAASLFTAVDSTSKHYESDHQGIILPNARHVIELNFDEHVYNAASMLGHTGAGNEREVLLGRGHEFELHPRPTLVLDHLTNPVYVWKAFHSQHLPRPKKL